MDERKKSYYAVIPANVRYDESLPPNAKLLYGEITALCNVEGYCWASNKYFADLYGVSTVSISKWINALANRGYISSQIIYKEGTKEIDKRYITIIYDPIKENFNTSIKEKLKDNNTSFNNTFNNTNEYIEIKDKPPTRTRFIPPKREEVQAYCQERQNDVDVERFVDYYTSNGWMVGKNRMKDWKAAVRTWEKNGYGKSKPKEQQEQQGSGNFFIDMMVKEGYTDE